MDPSLEQLIRDAERHSKSKDEWRKSALVSLAVGNGGGLAALAAWEARFDKFEAAIELFLPSMWTYAAGLLFAGALPFSAWWVAHILSDTRAAQRDQQIAKQIVPRGTEEYMKQAFMLAHTENRLEKARYIIYALYIMRALIIASAGSFVFATVLALSSVSDFPASSPA